jgi:hypothetical protein
MARTAGRGPCGTFEDVFWGDVAFFMKKVSVVCESPEVGPPLLLGPLSVEGFLLSERRDGVF